MAKKNSKKTVPDLRFRGFTDPWEQRQLGEVTARRSVQAISTKDMPAVEYEDVEAGRGTLEPSFTLKKGKSGIRFESGDVLYGKLRPYLGNRLKPNFRGVAVGDWWVLVPSSVASSFLFSLIQSPMFVTVANQSSGSKMPRADWKLVGSAAFGIPSLAEQHRIGDFFSTLDSLIAAAERQEALLRQKKQAYLQLMFPREGETEPRLRFAGYNGEWERRQLGEVAEVHNGRDYKHLRPGSIPVYGTSGYMLSVDDALSWNDDAVGIGRKGTIDRPYILRAPFWTVDTLFFVTPRPSTPLEFLFTVFESVNWESKDESTGVPSLTKQAIVNTAVKVPNTSEQRRIGEFFTQIDHMIEIISKQAAALQTMKRAYLQKMFI